MSKWKSLNRADDQVFDDEKVIINSLVIFMGDKNDWKGTASELLNELKQISLRIYEQELEVIPNRLTKYMCDNIDILEHRGLKVYKKHSGIRSIKIVKALNFKGETDMITKTTKKAIKANVLETIKELGPVSISDIATMAMISLSSARYTVKVLQKAGHQIRVERAKNGTRENHYVYGGDVSKSVDDIAVTKPKEPAKPAKTTNTQKKENKPMSDLVNRAYYLALALRRISIDDLVVNLDVSEDEAFELMVKVAKKYKDDISANISIQCK